MKISQMITSTYHTLFHRGNFPPVSCLTYEFHMCLFVETRHALLLSTLALPFHSDLCPYSTTKITKCCLHPLSLPQLQQSFLHCCTNMSITSQIYDSEVVWQNEWTVSAAQWQHLYCVFYSILTPMMSDHRASQATCEKSCVERRQRKIKEKDASLVSAALKRHSNDFI